MGQRFWGEEIDTRAAQQLGVSEDYTVVMMANQVDHLGDLDEVKEEFSELGYVDAEDVINAVNEKVTYIDLPGGLRLVGMRPLDSEAGAPRKYGIVDLTGCEWPKPRG